MNPYIVKELCQFLCKSTKNCIPLPKNKMMYYWDLTIVLNGTLSYTIDGIKYTVQKNDVLLVPINSLRERTGGTEADYICFNFIPIPDINLPTGVLYKNALSTETQKIISIFPQKRVLWDKNFYAMDYEREKITNLCNYVIFELLSKINFRLGTNNSHVQSAIAYVNDNLLNRISLDDLSQHLSLSKEYTASLFKRELGRTVSEYINERKMTYAKQAIQSQNDCPLWDLANKLGYDNYGYFSRTFKKYYNISPQQYRSEINKALGNIQSTKKTIE